VLRSLRTLAIAAISSFGLVLYLVLWFRWPITLSLGAGALMAMVVVMTSASLGADPAKADAAWRAAAPDLQDVAQAPTAAAPTAEATELAALPADGPPVGGRFHERVAIPIVADQPSDPGVVMVADVGVADADEGVAMDADAGADEGLARG
jgi:hypothetical protein